MFSENGDGLKFSITVDHAYSNDWMTFALWYSMQKFIPDAKLHINCQSPKVANYQLFNWCKKCDVSFGFNIAAEGVKILPYTMMVRTITEGTKIEDMADLCSESHKNLFTPFISYHSGFGNFVTSQWIHTMECPFSWADRFITDFVNVNEMQIIRLWKQLDSVYAAVSKG